MSLWIVGAKQKSRLAQIAGEEKTSVPISSGCLGVPKERISFGVHLYPVVLEFVVFRPSQSRLSAGRLCVSSEAGGEKPETCNPACRGIYASL